MNDIRAELPEWRGQVGHTVGNRDRRGSRLAFRRRRCTREVRRSLGVECNECNMAARQIHRAQHGAAQDQRVGVQRQHRPQVTIAVLHFHLVRAKANRCQKQQTEESLG